MILHSRSIARRLTGLLAGLGVVIAAPALWPSGAQPRQAPPQRAGLTFRTSVDLVTINVVVRDRNGNVVKGLTRDDFVILEENRPQTVAAFDFEEIASEPAAAPAAMPTVLGGVGRAPAPAAAPAPAPATPVDMHGRRLIVMLFDLSSMQPEEVLRSTQAAREYIEQRLSPSDLVAVATLSTTLQVPVDFTADRAVLVRAMDVLSGVEGMGFEEAASVEAAEDATAFTADEAEFALFNTDRRLQALQTLTEALAGIEQKKSLIYFSSGMTQTGLDNRVAIRSVIDRAVRANVSIYTADMRGLQAIAPGGDASTASARGQSAFSGRGVSQRFEQMAASQEALSTLAEDTGGRAFFDENDMRTVFDRVVADTSAYYLLGFVSTNPARDGRFRRVRVTVKRPDVKLEYRAGYYAPRDFAHSGRDDRELQLTEQLFSDLSVTDLPVYASSAYFRLKGNRYFVPIWFVVSGAKIPFDKSGNKDKATLDILAVVRDEQQRPVARIRDTVKLSVAATEDVRRKNVQYQTDLELPPGLFRLKVVVRENQGGTIGSFEGNVAVPDLARYPLRVSSVVVGTRLQSTNKRDPRNPLLQGGQELIPSVAHVTSAGQPLFLYYEMYDAASPTAPGAAPVAAPTAPAPAATGQPIRVLSNVVFFKGTTKVLETRLLEATAFSSVDRRATTFRLDVPTTDLQPGLYTCQVNVVDDVAGSFAFPRLAVYVRK